LIRRTEVLKGVNSISKIAIARITGQENKEIKLLCDSETFEVTADNGDGIMYGSTPKSVAEAFKLVNDLWGVDPSNVWELEWLAEYDENHNKIIVTEERYYIDYGTGAGNEWVDGTLDEAKQTADQNASYTQCGIGIFKDGNEVCYRKWWSTLDDIEEFENPIQFGSFGYYTDWQDVD
jgi:hypothetical protein